MSDYHDPVLLKESIAELLVDPDGVYMDMTFGGGGHSQAILSGLTSKGKLIVFDQDDDAEMNLIDDDRLVFIKSNFRHVYRYWKWMEIQQIDGVLADLGVSSYQFDEKDRGFSYRFDAELDMRMNQEAALTASDVLNSYSEEALQKVFSEYGEIRNSKTLAQKIGNIRRTGRSISSSFDFNSILESVKVGDKFKYMSQAYQALRMEVNDELGALKEMLQGALRVLKPGGILVVISYHSIEDRIVKRFFKTGNFEGRVEKDEYGRSLSKIKMLKNLILPDEEEQKRNIRSRSAKMRVAIKISN